MNFNFKKENGMIALLTVFIISSTALIMAITSSLLGLGELEMGFNSQKGMEALSIADSCVEEGLRRLRLDPDYSGGNLMVGDGFCTIQVVNQGGGDRSFLIEAVLDNYYENLEVEVTLANSSTTINSWNQVE
jgi:hypothetical protein